jgi:hypothetical protein
MNKLIYKAFKRSHILGKNKKPQTTYHKQSRVHKHY